MAHIKSPFLNYSETFIYNYIRHLTSFEPIVVTEYALNQNQYPVDHLIAFRKHLGWFEEPLALARTYLTKFVPRDIVTIPFYVRALRSLDAKLMHLHFGLTGLLLAPVKKRINLPMIVSFYGCDLSQLPGSMGKDVYARNGMFELGEMFTTEGSFARRALLELGCPREKVAIVHIGVDLSLFTFRPRQLLSGEKPRLFFCGRFVPKKGLLTALRALVEVKSAGYDFELRVAGSGPQESEVRAFVRENDLSKQVAFLGVISHRQFSIECHHNHLLLVPSQKDFQSGDSEGGSPTVILEAQATGMPVISTRHADIPEAVVDGCSGYLAIEGSVRQFAQCLTDALEHPERWPEMGKAGRRHVEKEYNIREVVQKLELLYSQLLEGGKAHAGTPIRDSFR